jgi:hypothetical protein
MNELLGRAEHLPPRRAVYLLGKGADRGADVGVDEASRPPRNTVALHVVMREHDCESLIGAGVGPTNEVNELTSRQDMQS